MSKLKIVGLLGRKDEILVELSKHGRLFLKKVNLPQNKFRLSTFVFVCKIPPPKSKGIVMEPV